MSNAAAASRRTTEHVYRLIVDAAAGEFAAGGYGGATMRSIAAKAGISLSVLHRHFPSKRDLLRAAALDPFLRFFAEFTATREAQAAHPADDEWLLRELVRDLRANLTTHRRTLLSLAAAADGGETELLADLRAELEPIMAKLRAIGADEAARRGTFDAGGAAEGVWLVTSLIMGLVLTEPWLPGRPDHVGDDEAVVEAITRFSLLGITGRPRDPQTPET